MSALTHRRPLPNVFRLSAQTVAKKLQWPLSTWAGHCFTLADMMVSKGVVEGTAVYGHWLGDVSPQCKMFYGKPIIQHGWVLQSDGSVVDPTRFVFEGAEPYIYKGPADYYDEGGNAGRSKMMRPPPDFKKSSDPFHRLEVWKPKNKRLASAVDLLMEPALRKPGKLTREQLHWLANLPYDALTPIPGFDLAPALYAELKKLGMEAHVPIDNQRRAARARTK